MVVNPKMKTFTFPVQNIKTLEASYRYALFINSGHAKNNGTKYLAFMHSVQLFYMCPPFTNMVYSLHIYSVLLLVTSKCISLLLLSRTIQY